MDKKKVLFWSDSATAGTGFGVVSKHILKAIHETGRYDIHHLAINFHGDFVDQDQFPWQIQPARLLDPRDPHGMKMFYKSALRMDYDIIFILNDLYVTHPVSEAVDKIKEAYVNRGKKVPIFIYYYPVDSKVHADATGMIEKVDFAVCYTGHGQEETLKTLPDIEDRLIKIPHGVDSKAFYPLNKDQINLFKQQFFNVRPETTIVVNVNRNSARKQIPYSMMAFKKFREHVPDSIMYVHAVANDQGGDLVKAIHDLGMSPKTDIILPARYSPSTPAPDEVLNRLYNCGDIFLTTHLGEGWGLTVTEAMAAGVPVVAPNNTAMPEQLGENSERGFMYECEDVAHIDNSGFRPKGNLDAIVEQMLLAHESPEKKINDALMWARGHDWSHVTKQWVDLFRQAEVLHETKSEEVTEEV